MKIRNKIAAAFTAAALMFTMTDRRRSAEC